MNYQEFLTAVRTELSGRVDADVSMDIQHFIKNNSTHYDGLVLLRSGRNVSPAIYLLPYYHRYLEGVCLSDICDDILETYRIHEPEENFDTARFTDFSRASGQIVMRLVSMEKNRELLEDVPHFRYQDLAVVFCCMLRADKQQQANILIHNQHLLFWNTTADELYTLAMQNTRKLLPPQLIPMSSLLDDLPEDGGVPVPPLYILTNEFRTNGATAILYDGMLAEISAMFGRDLILLPSSIHEMLLLPADPGDKNRLDHFSQLVQEVNHSQLADEEILSDHAYYYSREDGVLSFPPSAAVS